MAGSPLRARSLVIAAAIAASPLGAIAAAYQASAPSTAPAPAAAPAAPARAKPAIYDEKADARKQIAAALAKAKKENKRVLVQWGGNWCPWCIRLHELFKADKKIARELLYEYEVVLIDAGQPAGKNVDLARSYGAEVDKHGFPFLTVLDGSGKPIANQETEALEAKGPDGKSAGVKAGHNPEAVLKFLTANKAAYLPAKDVLADGLAQAKAGNKRVLLHFGAPWCGWCHRLEDWMARPEIAVLLAKDFVDVKIDTDRTVGGQDMLKTMNPPNDGIPWMAVLDAEGKPLSTSTGPKGNIGFPSSADEIAHFETMLKQTAKSLTAAEISTLIESLRAKEKPAAATPAATK